MKPIDIGPSDLETVRRVLREHVPGLEVWAFGSRVSWTARETSDLDIALMTTEPLDAMRLAEMREAFVQSDLPFRVDIVDWSSTSKAFQNIIERNFVAVQAGTSGKWNGRDELCEVLLTDIAELIMGQSPPSSTYNKIGKGLPFFQGVKDFNYRHPTPRVFCSKPSRIVQPGDILLSVRAPIGRVNVADRKCAVGRGLAIIRPHDQSDTRYLEFLLRRMDSSWDVFENSGSVFGNATKQDLETLPLAWMRNKQKRRFAAHILGTLDDKIELNWRMNKTLEEMARALFKSWFVNFDPVRAKMDGRWRPGESLPGLPAHLYDLFSDSLVDSELGEIPKEWEVKALREIAEQRRSGANPVEIDPNTPYIALKHMPKYCIALSEWGTADGLASSKYRFKQGDILFGKLRPYFHKVGVAPLDGVCSTDIVVISPISQDWFGFILGHASSSEFIDYTDAGSTGTKMPRTKWADMGRYKVASPGQELAKAFTELIQPCIDKIIFAIHDSCALVAKRDVLLPKLISGELHAFQPAYERNTAR